MAGNWEYKIMEYPKAGMMQDQLIVALNTMGSEGWELFQISPPVFYFKRPKAGSAQSNFGS
jgi:Domain of unknown function (DUF4177)